MNINIITAYEKPIFMHQLDTKRFERKIYFAENSHENIIWDFVVVFQNLTHEFDGIKYRKGGLIFIAGEPECAEPYCRKFLQQFDYAIVPHPHSNYSPIIHTNPALNWHYGRSYSKGCFKYDFEELNVAPPISDKHKNISMMCSNKTMMPGHVMRYKFYKLLKEKLEGKIDFFGAGIRLVDDKADILNPYRFHICIENSKDEHYWTEKIADPILGLSVPIYCGAPNIYDYFPKDSLILIDINKPLEALEIIRIILDSPEMEYQKRLPALLEARKLLINKYNLFPMLENFIQEQKPVLGDVKNLHIIPYTEMTLWKIRMSFARVKRFAFKITHK